MSKSGQKKLEGRVAIVTGSSSTAGIGFSIAKRLASDGANVMISSRKEENVKKALERLRQEVQGGGKVEGMVCHVGNNDHRINLVKETISKFGKLDILVSAAGVSPTVCHVLDIPESAWDKALNVNVKAAALLVKEAYPYLKESPSPSVVLLSSLGGLVPVPHLGAYSVSKTALLGLTKVLSQELGPDGIRVNCIAPGVVKTHFGQAIWEGEGVSEQSLSQIPLNRFGEPNDCSGVVSFLCSEDARYVTGETIVIAGGTQSRL